MRFKLEYLSVLLTYQYDRCFVCKEPRDIFAGILCFPKYNKNSPRYNNTDLEYLDVSSTYIYNLWIGCKEQIKSFLDLLHFPKSEHYSSVYSCITTSPP